MNIIKGGIAQDQRGHIRFVNDFDMSLVKRFYIIKNADTALIRGWRAHRIEDRWFYVLAGGFSLDVVEIDDWENASTGLTVKKISLVSEEMNVIHVPAGYGTAFQATMPESELLVFANYGIEHAANDDYTWPIDYFTKRESL
ncbi:sugar epimerase [Sphingobacterium paludis]|uniref:dTDP-4-dehydrorhamnose 3,5-epimerase n=1 Tax=Sphingobacterium paludis TaxID=1476465 RepID=A0A4R7D088_9SPHI|nr:sugar epimerase [Sphingobacterium paludis]TDS13707.1 hypothetical protein B0I21_10433 [Sphingobacterium paludis]